jgi:hypothetical protein
LIFSRQGDEVTVTNPNMETFDANFDRILEHCFGVSPPISQIARDEISELLTSDDITKLEQAMAQLGSSVEKSFVADTGRHNKVTQAFARTNPSFYLAFGATQLPQATKASVVSR